MSGARTSAIRRRRRTGGHVDAGVEGGREQQRDDDGLGSSASASVTTEDEHGLVVAEPAEAYVAEAVSGTADRMSSIVAA